MKLQRKHIFMAAGVAVLLLAGVIVNIWNDLDGFEDGLKPKYEVKKIDFPKKKASIYLKRKTWGVRNNQKLVVISEKKEKEFQPDSLSEYIISGSDAIYYTLKNDTLLLYTQASVYVPPGFSSHVVIKTIPIDNFELMDSLRDNANGTYETF